MTLRTLRIGDWLLDPSSGELSRGDQRCKLTPKSTALLCVLAARPGELVTKSRLLESVWPGTVVTESVLSSCVRELRAAFADDARQPRMIVTMHRRGYRLVAPVCADNHARQVANAPADFLPGREPELRALNAALERASTGQRQTVLITGEPGIGKTALLEAFLSNAGRQHARITRGQCIQHHGPAEAYLPVLESVEKLCRDDPGPLTIATLSRHAPTWLAYMPGLLTTAELRAVRQRQAGANPQRVMRELTSAIEELAAADTLILCFEDLHWSDTATLDWLTHVARRREPARVLIVGTYRRAEVLARGHAMQNVHAELAGQGMLVHLPLGPLDRNAVRSLVSRRFPLGDDVEALADRIHARTEGHPLFALNMVDEVLATGRLDEVTAAVESLVPGDVRRMIEHRILQLAPAQRRLLEIASVVGTTFDASALAAADCIPTGNVEDTLRELAERESFIAQAGDGDRFCFRHVLYRDVLYERCGSGTRTLAHLRLGEWFEKTAGTRAQNVATELAVHFEQGNDFARAVAWHRRAAENAIRLCAPGEAIAHLERARELLQNLLESDERLRIELEVCIALGSQLMAAGGWGAADVEKVYSRAQQLYAQLSRQHEAFPALWGLWLYRSGHGELREAQRLSGELLQLAARSAGDTNVRLQAHHAAWATALARGELRDCCEHVAVGASLYDPRQHHELAGRYGNHDAAVCAHSFGSLAFALRGSPERAIAEQNAALALAKAHDHPFTTAFAHFFSGALNHLLDDPRQTVESASRAIEVAGEQSFSLIQAWGLCLQAWADVRLRGRSDGLDLIARNIAAARTTGNHLFQAYLFGLLADACLRMGNLAAGMSAVEDGKAAAQRSGEWFFLPGLMCLEVELRRRTGTPGEALAAALDKAVALAHEQGSLLFERRAQDLLSDVRGGASVHSRH